MIDIEYTIQLMKKAYENFDWTLYIPESFSEMARQLDFEIVKMDFTEGIYSGVVIAKADESWLVACSGKKAVMLNFEEVSEGEVVPQLFDEVLICFWLGIGKVAVIATERNGHADSKGAE